jgi:hypothetical protein
VLPCIDKERDNGLFAKSFGCFQPVLLAALLLTTVVLPPPPKDGNCSQCATGCGREDKKTFIKPSKPQNGLSNGDKPLFSCRTQAGGGGARRCALGRSDNGRQAGLDGESADRAIMDVVEIEHCLRDRVPNFTPNDRARRRTGYSLLLAGRQPLSRP